MYVPKTRIDNVNIANGKYATHKNPLIACKCVCCMLGAHIEMNVIYEGFRGNKQQYKQSTLLIRTHTHTRSLSIRAINE